MPPKQPEHQHGPLKPRLFLPRCSPSRQPAEGSSHRRAELGSLVSGWKPGPLLRTGHHPVGRGDQRLLRARDIPSLGYRCVWKSIAHVGCTVFWMSCCSENALGGQGELGGASVGGEEKRDKNGTQQINYLAERSHRTSASTRSPFSQGCIPGSLLVGAADTSPSEARACPRQCFRRHPLLCQELCQ